MSVYNFILILYNLSKSTFNMLYKNKNLEVRFKNNNESTDFNSALGYFDCPTREKNRN